MTIDVIQRASSANAPELVLLHAFPYSSKMWGSLISSLHKADITIVTATFPGFGGTPNKQWTMPSLAKELHQSLIDKDIMHPVLCGLSMGGYLAFAYYRLYPQEVSGLILADTKAFSDNSKAKADREAFVQEVLTRGSVVLEERQLDKMTSSWTKEHNPDLVDTIKSWMREADPEAIANALRAMANRDDSTDLLSSITVPTLLIVGEEDAISPPKEMHSFSERIPSALFVTIPHAGHLSAVEQPEIFSQALQDFLLRSSWT